MSIQSKKQKLVNHDNYGKILEKSKKNTDWRAYNKELNRLTKDYTKDTKEAAEKIKDEEIHRTASEFTDRLWHQVGRTKVFSIPELPWKK